MSSNSPTSKSPIPVDVPRTKLDDIPLSKLSPSFPSLPPTYLAGGLAGLHCGLRPFSPPTLTAHQCPNRPEYNVARLVEYRGTKVAAFPVDGTDMLCLPQAFELFLRHLVGGLHTVYTKLKRLGIAPLVCNVEQVRVLRGLGSIQPGVNRCKLIAAPDFDTLYEDCTSAGSRPGRPPKRSAVFSPVSSSGLLDSSTPDKIKIPRLDRSVLPASERSFTSALPRVPYPNYPFSYWPYSAAQLGSLSMLQCHSLLAGSGGDIAPTWPSIYRHSLPTDGSTAPLTPGADDKRMTRDRAPRELSPTALERQRSLNPSPTRDHAEPDPETELLRHYPYFPRRSLASTKNRSSDSPTSPTLDGGSPTNNYFDLPPGYDVERPDLEKLLEHVLGLLQAAVKDIKMRDSHFKAERDRLESQYEEERERRRELEHKLRDKQAGCKSERPDGNNDAPSAAARLRYQEQVARDRVSAASSAVYGLPPAPLQKVC